MLRRYTPLSPSRGTVIPAPIRAAVLERDGGCVGRLVGFPTECAGPLDVDHVRASGALGKKSRTTLDNLVALCSLACHRWKTAHGREARPLLLEYLAWLFPETGECEHVEPHPSCVVCLRRARETA